MGKRDNPWEDLILGQRQTQENITRIKSQLSCIEQRHDRYAIAFTITAALYCLKIMYFPLREASDCNTSTNSEAQLPETNSLDPVCEKDNAGLLASAPGLLLPITLGVIGLAFLFTSFQHFQLDRKYSDYSKLFEQNCREINLVQSAKPQQLFYATANHKSSDPERYAPPTNLVRAIRTPEKPKKPLIQTS